MVKGFVSAKDVVQPRPAPQPLPLAVDAESVQAQWQAQFADLEDPRGCQGIDHPFLSIVMIAILAVIGGATGWEDIKTYAESHQVWLSTLFPLPNSVPPANTYRRLFERMAPDALERCFLGWVQQIVEGSGSQVIPNPRCHGHPEGDCPWDHRARCGLRPLSQDQNHPTLWAEVTVWLKQAESANFAGLEHSYDARVESGHHRILLACFNGLKSGFGCCGSSPSCRRHRYGTKRPRCHKD